MSDNSLKHLISQTSLPELVGHYSYWTGHPEEFLHALLLMLVSTNLGIYIDIPPHPRVRAYPNIYTILVAPPGVHHKSTIIAKERSMTSIIDNKVKNSDFVKSVSVELSGSYEGIMEKMSKVEKIMFRNDEFGRFLSASARGSYEAGALEALNNAYYLKGTTSARRSLIVEGGVKEEEDKKKKKKVNKDLVVNDGTYTTLFAAIHEDEMTNEMYRIGMVRRSLVVYLSYPEIVVSDAAYDEDECRLADDLEDAIVEMLAKTRLRVIDQSFQEKWVDKGMIDGVPHFEKEIEQQKITFRYSESAINFLRNLYKEAMTTAKKEERQLYPDESVELITRIGINVMLWDLVRKEGYGDLVLEEKHLVMAREFVEKINSNYVKTISKIETKDTAERAKRVINYVEKVCDGKRLYINQGEAMNAIGQSWENQQRENAILHAIGENKIGRMQVLYQKRTGSVLCLFRDIDRVLEELEKLKVEGKIVDYREGNGWRKF